jgi:hypothetical protein
LRRLRSVLEAHGALALRLVPDPGEPRCSKLRHHLVKDKYSVLLIKVRILEILFWFLFGSDS